MSDLLAAARSAAGAANLRFTVVRNPPASVEALTALEGALGIRLSPSHAAFLRTTDGLLVGLHFGPATQAHDDPMYFGVNIHGCSQIERETVDNRRIFAISADLIAVARYGMSGDQCFGSLALAQAHEYPITDGFHETPDRWGCDVLAPTFHDWFGSMFRSFIEKRHLFTYWLDDGPIEAVRTSLLTS